MDLPVLDARDCPVGIERGPAAERAAIEQRHEACGLLLGREGVERFAGRLRCRRGLYGHPHRRDAIGIALDAVLPSGLPRLRYSSEEPPRFRHRPEGCAGDKLAAGLGKSLLARLREATAGQCAQG